jgi:hypothetical protein
MRALLLSTAMCFSAMLMGPAAKADTLVFDFSFSGTYNQGTVRPGTVTGVLNLSGSGASYAATSVIIDTATNDIGGDTLPYNVLSFSGVDIVSNAFTVSAGQIVAADLNLVVHNDPSEPDFSSIRLNFNTANEVDFGNALYNTGGFSGVTYTPVPSATPEPASLGFLLEGATAGAWLLRRRGRR